MAWRVSKDVFYGILGLADQARRAKILGYPFFL